MNSPLSLPEMELVQRRVRLAGRVQGVFFRESTRQRARDLGLTGWVRNLSDGRVESVFQGQREAIDEMIRWCHQGPPQAQVTNVEVSEESPDQPFPGFAIRRTE